MRKSLPIITLALVLTSAQTFAEKAPQSPLQAAINGANRHSSQNLHVQEPSLYTGHDDFDNDQGHSLKLGIGNGPKLGNSPKPSKGPNPGNGHDIRNASRS